MGKTTTKKTTEGRASFNDENSVTGRGTEARQRIVTVAEALFSQQGFDGTSMRQIATEAKLQAASLYYYFPSKEELLWAVWEGGGVELLARAQAAADSPGTTWDRMEVLCIAHIAGLLDWRKANQMLFIMPPWQYPETIRARVIALRDEYESVFASVIEELPLRADVDRRQFRRALFGALSWTLFWYRPEGDPLDVVARQILDLLRNGVDSCQPKVQMTKQLRPNSRSRKSKINDKPNISVRDTD